MHKIEDLRAHLFDTIEALKNKEKPMELDRAKTIAGVAQTIINSAKVEVDFMRTTGQAAGTGFISQPELAPPKPGDAQRALNHKVAART